MGLTISLKPGEDFYIEDEQFVVTEVYSETHFQVRRVCTDETFEITPDHKTEILDAVFLFGAVRKEGPKARLKLDVSQQYTVRRGSG